MLDEVLHRCRLALNPGPVGALPRIGHHHCLGLAQDQDAGQDLNGSAADSRTFGANRLLSGQTSSQENLTTHCSALALKPCSIASLMAFSMLSKVCEASRIVRLPTIRRQVQLPRSASLAMNSQRATFGTSSVGATFTWIIVRSSRWSVGRQIRDRLVEYPATLNASVHYCTRAPSLGSHLIATNLAQAIAEPRF